MADKTPAKQVSPFAAMTFGAQDARWMALHSQMLPYMIAVPAKEPAAAGDGKAPVSAWRAGTPAQSQMPLSAQAPMPGHVPVFNAAPQPARHDQYDAIQARMLKASKQALAWQEVKTNG